MASLDKSATSFASLCVAVDMFQLFLVEYIHIYIYILCKYIDIYIYKIYIIYIYIYNISYRSISCLVGTASCHWHLSGIFAHQGVLTASSSIPRSWRQRGRPPLDPVAGFKRLHRSPGRFRQPTVTARGPRGPRAPWGLGPKLQRGRTAKAQWSEWNLHLDAWAAYGPQIERWWDDFGVEVISTRGEGPKRCCRGERPESEQRCLGTLTRVGAVWFRFNVELPEVVLSTTVPPRPQHPHPRNLQWHPEANCSCGWEGQGERHEWNEGQRDQRGPSQIAGHGRLRRQRVFSIWVFPRFPQQYPLVNKHRPWQIGVGRLVSIKN